MSLVLVVLILIDELVRSIIISMLALSEVILLLLLLLVLVVLVMLLSIRIDDSLESVSELLAELVLGAIHPIRSHAECPTSRH